MTLSFLLKGIKKILLRVFNIKNVTGPIKFILRLILGRDVFMSKEKAKTAAYLHALWEQSSGGDLQQ